MCGCFGNYHYSTITMENILLEAINYVSNVSRQKVTVDNISTFLDKRGPNNLDNEVIIKTLQEVQAKGLINKCNRLTSPKTPVSNPSPAQASPDPVTTPVLLMILLTNLLINLYHHQ